MENKTTLKKLTLKVGPYDLKAIPTGIFGLDGGAMFGTVPKVLWQKTNPADENNRIKMEARSLLLVSNDRKILIDVGNGSDFIAKYGEKAGGKFAEIYAVQEGGDSLFNSLKNQNITPDEITDVILTHLHFDHCGGSTTANSDSTLVPTFPNATYHVQKANYNNALNPNIRERASYLPQNFEPLMKTNKLKFVEGNVKNYLPHISFFVSDGHTVGHQAVIIEDENTQVIYCGDVIPTSTHVRSAWIMGYDLNPLLLIEEKSKLLSLTENKNSYLYFEHDPYCDLASVEKIKNEFQVKERFQI